MITPARSTAYCSSLSPRLRLGSGPLPLESSWRRAVIRLADPLAPLFLIGILIRGVLDWDTFAWPHWSCLVADGLLFTSGGAFALSGAIGLGLNTSQGHGGPLVPQGAYRFSRDLQRVGDVAVLLGYSLVCDSLLALVAMLFLSWWYLLARLAEAPWLREDLGSAFEVYVGRGPQSLADRGVRPNRALQRTA